MAEGEVASLWVRLGLVPDEGEFERGNELIEKIKRGLEYFAGFEAVRGIFEMVRSTTEAAVANKHLAERLGTTVGAIQELGYAADVSGASAGAMTASLTFLQRNLEHVRQAGTGLAASALSQLHLSFSAIQKLPLDEKVASIAEAFKNAGPGVNKTALAVELFGRQGTQMLPLLNKGAEGVRGMRDEFRALGVETSEKMTEALEDFEIEQKKLGYVWRGLKKDVVVALLPALKELVSTFMAWVQAHRAAIESTLSSVIATLSSVFENLGAAIGAVTRFVGQFLDYGELLKSLIVGLGVVITAVAADAALAWITGFGPVGKVVLLFTAMIYLVKKLGLSFLLVAPIIAAALGTAFGPFYAVMTAVAALVAYMASLADSFGDFADAAEAAWKRAKKLPILGFVLTHAENFWDDRAASEAKEERRASSSGGNATTAFPGEPGYESPKISKGGAKTINQTNNIDVHTSPGMSEEDVARHVVDHIDRQNRDADAALGGE